jgi:hypothetical protein
MTPCVPKVLPAKAKNFPRQTALLSLLEAEKVHSELNSGVANVLALDEVRPTNNEV